MTTAAIKERPILFSGAMVRAILDGRKTQTRRKVKLPPALANTAAQFHHIDSVGQAVFTDGTVISCPYGMAGDRLWVRETWRPRRWDSDFDYMLIEYRADGDCNGTLKEVNPWNVWPSEVSAESLWDGLNAECLKANAPQDSNGNFICEPNYNPVKWRPSIFLPRGASRLLLEVKQIRVGRLQEISEADAIAEGVERVGDLWKCYDYCPDHDRGYDKRTSATASFTSLWRSINGASSWDANPWVWVVDFEVMS